MVSAHARDPVSVPSPAEGIEAPESSLNLLEVARELGSPPRGSAPSGGFSPECSPAAARKTQCPRFLVDRAYADREGSLIQTRKIGTESPSRACPFSLKNFSSHTDVATHLGRVLKSVPALDSSLPLDTACSSGLYWPPVSGPVFPQPVLWKLDESEKLNVILEYAHSKERLLRSRMAAMDAIASIDFMMGKNPLHEQGCLSLNAETPVRAERVRCHALKSCAADPKRETFQRTLGETHEILRAVAAAQSAGKIEEAKKLSAIAESVYPWLKGKRLKHFAENAKSGHVPSRTVLNWALERQLTETREKLLKQVAEQKKADRCLDVSGGDVSKYCGGFDKALSAAEPLSSLGDVGVPTDSSEKKRAIVAGSFFAHVECLQAHREVKSMTNDWAFDTAVGAGVAFATMGLGSVVAAGRAAEVAIKSGEAAGALRKLEASRRAGVTALRVLYGVDGAWSLETLHQVSKQCGELLNQLEVRQDPQANENSCPGGAMAAQALLTSDVRACVISAALGTAVAAIPFASYKWTQFSANRKIQSAIKKQDTQEIQELQEVLAQLNHAPVKQAISGGEELLVTIAPDGLNGLSTLQKEQLRLVSNQMVDKAKTHFDELGLKSKTVPDPDGFKTEHGSLNVLEIFGGETLSGRTISNARQKIPGLSFHYNPMNLGPEETLGYYVRSQKAIGVPTAAILRPNEMSDTLLHEIRHAHTAAVLLKQGPHNLHGRASAVTGVLPPLKNSMGYETYQSFDEVSAHMTSLVAQKSQYLKLMREGGHGAEKVAEKLEWYLRRTRGVAARNQELADRTIERLKKIANKDPRELTGKGIEIKYFQVGNRVTADVTLLDGENTVRLSLPLVHATDREPVRNLTILTQQLLQLRRQSRKIADEVDEIQRSLPELAE